MFLNSGIQIINFFLAEELGVSRDTGDTGTNLAEILSNALPQTSSDYKIKEKSSDSSVSIKKLKFNVTIIIDISGLMLTVFFKILC